MKRSFDRGTGSPLSISNNRDPYAHADRKMEPVFDADDPNQERRSNKAMEKTRFLTQNSSKGSQKLAPISMNAP